MLGWFSAHVFLGSAQRRLLSRGTPAFTWHKISRVPPRTADPFLYTTPAIFDEQLAALRASNYVSGSLTDLARPDGAGVKRAVLTFDDGFENVLRFGLEPLARHKFIAIQFLVAGALGCQNDWDISKGDTAERLMDEGQVREWLAAGHEIGSHSKTHRNLRHLSRAEATEEILGSKKSLEDRFGRAIKHFCYPYGSWNPLVRDVAASAGYETACTMDFGVNPAKQAPFALKRIIPLSNSAMLSKIFHRLQRKLRPSPKPK